MSLIQNNLNRTDNDNIPNGTFINNVIRSYFGVNKKNSFIVTDEESILDATSEIRNSMCNISDMTIQNNNNYIVLSICNVSNLLNSNSFDFVYSVINGLYDMSTITNWDFEIVNSLVNSLGMYSVHVDTETYYATINRSIINNLVLNTRSYVIYNSQLNGSIFGSTTNDKTNTDLILQNCIFNNCKVNNTYSSGYSTYLLDDTIMFNSTIDMGNISTIKQNLSNTVAFSVDDDFLNWSLNTKTSINNKLLFNGDVYYNEDLYSKKLGYMEKSYQGDLFYKEQTEFDEDNWETENLPYGYYHYSTERNILYVSQYAYTDSRFGNLLDRFYPLVYTELGDIFYIDKIGTDIHNELASDTNTRVKTGVGKIAIYMGQQILLDDISGDIVLRNTKQNNYKYNYISNPMTFRIASDDTLSDGNAYYDGDNVDLYLSTTKSAIGDFTGVLKIQSSDVFVIMQDGRKIAHSPSIAVEELSGVIKINNFAPTNYRTDLEVGSRIEVFFYH